MPTITYVHPDGTKQDVTVAAGKRIMHSAIANDIDGIVGECGGQVMCATCHVYVDEAWADRVPPITDEEDEMLDGTASPRTGESRLSCQIPVTDDLDGIVVRLPDEQA
ncbi:2Fe-2S iron-sulfur cluster-binding protein [Mycolicibacterium austroafricanum]|jgi:2Fe-2S ferredoxin|uniref:2Fe-2S iron-sulfur cluster-binding protein n=1 Tax=Mycolicibacterium austroafricanum TaxID=39687 RepID=UPI00056A2896|nr:2Fe-2S iron-sulfur cluster-binding protein [Mycolicibacterium austroafricanum]QZY47052.1 2Fe-2S iron-sulfur cluster binding domain-containing protein [Mycolicibacterium austroafricanum]